MKNVFAADAQMEHRWASYPPFDGRHLRAIELALRRSWLALRKDNVKAIELSISEEVDISHLLRDELNDVRESKTGGVHGYNCEVFERPHLGAEIKTPWGKIRKPDPRSGHRLGSPFQTMPTYATMWCWKVSRPT
jgi:hypothetical protein